MTDPCNDPFFTKASAIIDRANAKEVDLTVPINEPAKVVRQDLPLWIQKFEKIEEKSSNVYQKFGEVGKKLNTSYYLQIPGGEQQSILHIGTKQLDVTPIASVSTMDGLCRVYVDHVTGVKPKGLAELIEKYQIPKVIKTRNMESHMSGANHVAYQITALMWSEMKGRSFGLVKTGTPINGTYYWYVITGATNSNGTKLLNRYRL